MTSDQVKAGLMLGAVALAGFAIWRASRVATNAAEAVVTGVKDAAWSITPWNDENIVYGGVNSVGAAVSGDKDWSLGGWIYDITHADPMATTPTRGAPATYAQYDALGNYMGDYPVNTGGASGGW